MQNTKCVIGNCKAYALQGQDRCFMHSDDPEIVKKRKDAQIRGGKKGKLQTELKECYNLDDLKEILSSEVHSLISSPTNSVVSRARAVAYVIKVLAELIEKSDIELRVAALEKKIL